MAIELKVGATNTIEAGEIVFTENSPVNCVCAIVRGKIIAKSDNVRLEYTAGSFVGCADVIKGRYLMDYLAVEKCVLYPFVVNDYDSLRNALSVNSKDYRGIIISGLAKNLGSLLQINSIYKEFADLLYASLVDNHKLYIDACKAGGAAEESFPFTSNMKPYKDESQVDQRILSYLVELCQVPQDVTKIFFSNTMEIALNAIVELCKQFVALLDNTIDVGNYVVDAYTTLYNDGDCNLLAACVRLYKKLEKAGRSDKKILDICETVRDHYAMAEKEITQHMGNPIIADRVRLKQLYESLSDGTEVASLTGGAKANVEDVVRSLKGSLKQILSFSKVEPALANDFAQAVNAFVDSKNRMSTDDEGRKLRRKVSDSFYKIYHAVFKNSLTAENLPKAVELFLNFNFVDERLLKKEELMELCEIDVNTEKSYICNIYTIPEWLTLIYEGKRMPSKNEFDLEYAESLRERKKSREIDDAQEKALLKDMDARLEYEIFNMFKSNHRIVNGQMSTFVPVLCSEQLMGTPLKLVLTKDRVGQMFEKYRGIDYSVFRREQMYANENRTIEKEPIMLEVGPDVVLFPVYGNNAIMWQEISAKKRDSAGRFFFPILLEAGLDDLVIKSLGRFRWELCRTMQGSAWNDVTVKSLTSDYSDYIQFYKKNRDLSDEKKEKVKLQIQKGKNNTREVFVQDYEQWIKSEANGGQKLNKPARGILAMYCPFNKEIRNNLKTQPAFQDAIEKFERERVKKAKELDLRHRAIVKKGLEIPDIMQDTLDFYTKQ